MRLNKRYCLTQLASALGAMVLVGCGGGGSDTATSHEQTSGGDAIKQATAAPSSTNTLTVRARADLAGVPGGPATYKQGAFMVIIANGQVINSIEVRATAFQDYAFTLPSVAAGTKVDVVFNNDGNTASGQDRNLFVESITANGQTILSTAPGVTYDRATSDKATAFDGINVLPGTSALWWNGALRFTLGTTTASALSPACAAFYASKPGFSLSESRSIDAIPVLAKPGLGVSISEPTYNTCLTRASDYQNPAFFESDLKFARVNYSRRQAFNADSSNYIIDAGNGSYHLFDGKTFKYIKPLQYLGGDSEYNWHPTNPDLLYYFPNFGIGMVLNELNVKTGATRVVGDFATRLKTKWPTANAAWTRSEGSPSKDGRYWCLMVDDGNWNGLGFFTWDRETNTILGMKDHPGGERPDHVSMSPSGNYCVTSGPDTIAYSRDLKTQKLVRQKGEHSDMALDANGDDVYVSTGYDDPGVPGAPIFMVNLRTGVRTTLIENTYLERTATAMHFSGRSMNKPGWVILSTYGDYNADTGLEDRKWFHQKVMAIELKANPKIYNLAMTRVKMHPYSYDVNDPNNKNGEPYFLEPQATVNRDMTKVLFNSNWNGNTNKAIDAYMIEIPTGALKDSTTPTPTQFYFLRVR